MFCKKCNYEHGDLYVCPSYDEETKIKLREMGKDFRKQCKEGSITIMINGKNINDRSSAECA